MLRRFVANDRPSFIIAVHTPDGARRDFCCHNDGVDCSARLRSVNKARGVNLREYAGGGGGGGDEPDSKRPRLGGHGSLARIIEFRTDWLPAYSDLCPNECDVFEWFLLHLHSYDDLCANYNLSSSSAECIVDRELDKLDIPLEPTQHPICTNYFSFFNLLPKLVVLLELFQWFHCPPAIYDHIIFALMHVVSYNNAPSSVFTHLRALCGPPYHTHLALMELATQAVSFTPHHHHLVSLPGSQHVHSLLRVVDGASAEKQNDIENFIGGFTCEFLVSHKPLLFVIQQQQLDRRTFHVTEAALSLHSDGGDNIRTLEFGAIRAYNTLFDSPRLRETIRLRSLDTLLEITWRVTTNNKIQVNTLYTTTASTKMTPYIQLEMAVLNVDVYGGNIEIYDDEGPDKKYSLSCETSSTSTDRTELGERTIVEETRQVDRYAYSHTWLVASLKPFDTTNVVLERTFILRGSVQFYNCEML